MLRFWKKKLLSQPKISPKLNITLKKTPTKFG